jgi:hypothetical protein
VEQRRVSTGPRARWLTDWARWIGRLVRRTDATDDPLRVTQKREVILDDSWTRVYGPSVESGGWCEIEYLRIPWVEEAKARAAAGLPGPPDRMAELRAALGKHAGRRSLERVQGNSTPSSAKPSLRPGTVDIRASQVRAGDGAAVCAGDVFGQACRCGAHHQIPLHGPVGDDLSVYCCPRCFSDQ